ncbi:MAG: flagellar biosynthesis regulator FlaF [Hyphomicrobiales bacterium]|nr:flagellar biosynthesis regulator FlaF [Hyphomicrobiales bacterium]
MNFHAYASILDDSSHDGKENEKRAFDHAIKLLIDSNVEPEILRDKLEALLFTERLWSILLDDLARPENGLPDQLKAKLISIGIWVMKEIVAIRQGKPDGMKALIEINQVIRDGLE